MARHLARLGKRVLLLKNRLVLLALAHCVFAALLPLTRMRLFPFFGILGGSLFCSGLVLPHLMVRKGGCYDGCNV